MKFGTATAHAKSPKRLNVAITRGRDVTVFICQAATMLRCSKMVHGQEKFAVAAFIRDAVQRKILHECAEFFDTHPDALGKRQAQGATKNKLQENQWRSEKFTFVYETKRAGRESKGPKQQLQQPQRKLAPPPRIPVKSQQVEAEKRRIEKTNIAAPLIRRGIERTKKLLLWGRISPSVPHWPISCKATRNTILGTRKWRIKD